MGTYDTRGGAAVSPPDEPDGVSKLQEDVLALLEKAGIDTQTNDQITALIMAAEARMIEANSPKARKLMLLKAKVEELGWEFGGDWPSFWFHRPTWGGWKNAASWSGSDNEPLGPDMKPAIYDTLPELVKGEGIEL